MSFYESAQRRDEAKAEYDDALNRLQDVMGWSLAQVNELMCTIVLRDKWRLAEKVYDDEWEEFASGRRDPRL